MNLFAITLTANHSACVSIDRQDVPQAQCLAVTLTANYSPAMVNETQITIRVPQDIAKELDALARLMAKSDRYKAIGLSKTAVYRLAIARGVQVLREELAADREK